MRLCTDSWSTRPRDLCETPTVLQCLGYLHNHCPKVYHTATAARLQASCFCRNSSLLGAKRSRCSEEAQLAGGLTQKPCVWSAPPCYLALEREAHSQGGLQSSLPHNQIASRNIALLEPMSGRLASSAGAERSLSPGKASQLKGKVDVLYLQA